MRPASAGASAGHPARVSFGFRFEMSHRAPPSSNRHERPIGRITQVSLRFPMSVRTLSARAFTRVPAIRTVALAALLAITVPAAQAADTVTVGGLSFVNKGLVGVGRLPADLRDKFGETVGSGSGLAADLKTWTLSGEGYQGVFYLLPDRGYNVTGTTDFRARLYKLSIDFKPTDNPSALPAEARQKTVAATLA